MIGRPFVSGMSGAQVAAVGGSGAWIEDAAGHRYLDGASGVFVTALGYNPPGVAERIAELIGGVQFAYAGSFMSTAMERLAELLAERAPDGLNRLWLTTSGASANETAIKLARQYHLVRGKPAKTVIVSRRHSYHGSTIAGLSLSGSVPRREPYAPYLIDVPHIAPPVPCRCAAKVTCSQCTGECAEELEETVERLGPDRVSAMILEPVSGAPLGALASSSAYLQRIRRICDRHDILLVVDEIVSGMGRCGDWFAIAESGVVPDIVTLGKGLGAGFTPIGAALVRDDIRDAFARAGHPFVHSESFSGHVACAAAAVATIEHVEEKGYVPGNREKGEILCNAFDALADHPLVGDVRGRGMLRGIELVRDKTTKEPFPRAERLSERVVEAARRRGVLLVAGNAAVNGVDGDTVVAAPPFCSTSNELNLIGETLLRSLDTI